MRWVRVCVCVCIPDVHHARSVHAAREGWRFVVPSYVIMVQFEIWIGYDISLRFYNLTPTPTHIPTNADPPNPNMAWTDHSFGFVQFGARFCFVCFELVNTNHDNDKDKD